jgi:hypothetical protein
MSDDVSEDILIKLEENREKILKHKNNVLANCLELSRAITRTGMFNGQSERFGRQLIQRGYAHDNSKLDGIEWDYLHRGEEFLELAHEQHVRTNDHHPEYWAGGLKEMPEVAIAEMVADWKARSNEFGTDLRAWVKDSALDKYDISPQGKSYKTIKKYLDLLLDEPF